jgi:hypothetical protein
VKRSQQVIDYIAWWDHCAAVAARLRSYNTLIERFDEFPRSQSAERGRHRHGHGTGFRYTVLTDEGWVRFA